MNNLPSSLRARPAPLPLLLWALAGCLWAGTAHAQLQRPAQAVTAPQAAPAAARSAAPPSAVPVRDLNRIVALVNSEPITERELRTRIERVQATQGANLPPAAELERQLLEALIIERTQTQWARASGIVIDAAALAEAEATVARQNGVTVAQLHQRLQADGLSLSGFRANLENELLLLRVREREVAARVRITELEIDAYLRQHSSAVAAAQTALHLAQIVIALPEGADAATVAERQARAADLLRRARAGEDFAALARQHSDGPERGAGGQMGLRSADRYPTLFVEAVRGQPRGALVGPLRSGAGFHVLQVLEQRNLNLPPTHLTQTRARHILLRPTNAAEEAAALQRLSEWRARLLAGTARFEDLAREHSQDGSAPEGGDLGWASPGQFVPEFEQTMNRLAPGEVAQPLRSRFGLHLIEVVQRREVETSALERRNWVRARLREQRSEQAYEEWARELRGRAYVELRLSER
ncbi:peptidylprolyl isomerase [Serpentinimonas barnesii]|uniref:peptidylprolyl isomerase n=1 Tax=Serpentinimonas barnesii TaxID=1458427 RepID=UPI000693A133|nr:peptidylprolyl isomerase [Serpentinimonas barnesii]